MRVGAAGEGNGTLGPPGSPWKQLWMVVAQAARVALTTLYEEEGIEEV